MNDHWNCKSITRTAVAIAMIFVLTATDAAAQSYGMDEIGDMPAVDLGGGMAAGKGGADSGHGRRPSPATAEGCIDAGG